MKSSRQINIDNAQHYHIRDYQGNVRAVIDQSGTLQEVNNYYPYGGLMGGGTAGVQPYKYGAKELDRQNGLDWYDSQARMYDPLLGRTPTIDPLAEKYCSTSPYAWCHANPVNRIDPIGMADYFNLNGDFVYHDGDDDTKYLVLSTSSNVNKIRKSVSKKEFILAPNNDVIAQMDELFETSDNGSIYEHGFNVYQNNFLGCIQTGTENEINLLSAQNKEYDVHIHQWNGENGLHGEGVPSAGDIKNKKANDDQTISVILGYGTVKNSDNSEQRDPRLTASATSTIYMERRRVPDINKKQISFHRVNFSKTLDYATFKKNMAKIDNY